jgi:hypothetical protein
MVLHYAHVNVAHTAPSIKAMPSIGPAKAPPASQARTKGNAAAKAGKRKASA